MFDIKTLIEYINSRNSKNMCNAILGKIPRK